VTTIAGSGNAEAIAIRGLKSSEEKRFKVGGVFIEIGLLRSRAHQELGVINPGANKYK
jgi:hypothetical protein